MVEFHTPEFDGPLDLLLALIQKNEVSIYDIPISLITDQFLEYIRNAENIGLGDLSEFYKMAANLIWIKSQMLLPKDVEFDEEYEDPRDELVQRLLEYSKFRKYSELLIDIEDTENSLPKRKGSDIMLPFSDDELFEDKNIRDLVSVFKSLMDSCKIDEKIFNIYEEVSEREKMTLLNELLEKKEVVKFSELFSFHPTPSHIICSFLAVLGQVKDKIITVQQSEIFGEIDIKKRPKDYNPKKADEYDDEYDRITAG